VCLPQNGHPRLHLEYSLSFRRAVRALFLLLHGGGGDSGADVSHDQFGASAIVPTIRKGFKSLK
jgi:hypothetical protein